ncbi:MAG: hypothetical protein JJT89_15005 [Nitriliruptoraceae bacterium]|nr:hypothetical protein [Nitriliruptoraceae bacterium]
MTGSTTILQPHPTRRRADPDPVRLAALLARAWSEVAAGRRPLAQLERHLSPAVRTRLAGVLRAPRPPATGPARVHRTVGRAPAPGVREVTVLLECDGRITALAVRMERHRDRWRATELLAPEHGLPALTTASVHERHRTRDAFDEVFEEAGHPLPDHLR